MGDLFTRPLTWTSSARLGGAQISHNFSLRPDLITYPLPEFNGQVGIPSTVDLLINGNKAYSSQINPGPYDITDASHINGAGNAVLVTTDALGRTVSVDVPFYVTSRLLKKGLFDYTVSTGSLRKDYGRKNFSYTQYAIDGSARYGLTNEWTIEGHAELATSLQVLGGGFVTNVGKVGVINASFMGTRYKGNSGHQLYVGYEYSSPNISFSTSYRKRSENYRDIASMDISNYEGNSRYDIDYYTETVQATVSKSFKELGGISLGYYSTKYRKDGERDSTISAGWSKSLQDYGNLSAYINRNSDKDNRWSVSLQWTISLDQSNSISTSIAQSDNGDLKDRSYNISYDRAMPTEGGFGWRMNYNHYNNDRDDYYNGAVSWRNNRIRAEAGAFGSSGDMSYWGDLTGSIVYMDGQVMMANEVTDSFVLVSAGGVPDVPVRYENNVIGKTNSKGYVFVPDVTSYYDAKFTIEGESLPLNVVARETEQRVAVRSNSGYKLEFPIDAVNPTILTLVDNQGNYIGIGSHVESDSGEDSYVGWDGEVYFEHLQERNTLNVRMANGGSCNVEVNLDSSQIESQDEIKTLGEFRCL